MAFTDAQKKDIRKYLGVPFGFYDFSTRLESMMDTVGADATATTEVVAWLDELALIDTQLTVTAGTTSYSYGNLKKVDEVEFYNAESGESAGAQGATDRGRSLIDRIARSLGVDDFLPNGDYFGGSRKLTVPLALG